MTSPLTAALARKWRMDVNTGTVATPTWTQVKGVAGFSPKLDTTMQDDSDYESAGWGSQAKTQMQWSIETKLVRKYGATVADYDPGQESLRAAADSFGTGATRQIRWYDRNPGSPEAYTGFGVVQWSPDGGNTTDLETVTVTITGQGARTAITNPAV